MLDWGVKEGQRQRYAVNLLPLQACATLLEHRVLHWGTLYRPIGGRNHPLDRQPGHGGRLAAMGEFALHTPSHSHGKEC